MYHIFFIYSSVDGHLGYCLVLAIANSAAVNIRVHVSFCLFKMFTFNIISREHNKVINLTESNPQRNPHNTEYMPDSGIAGSYSSSRFGFSRNLHTVLYSGCINLYSYQPCMRFPFLYTLSSTFFFLQGLSFLMYSVFLFLIGG